MDTERSAITEPVRRIEVFTGAGRRRTWSAEDKAQIVAESVTSGESVCAVARRHGLSPQQLLSFDRRDRVKRGNARSDHRGDALVAQSEREARIKDNDESGSMEKKKREGYF